MTLDMAHLSHTSAQAVVVHSLGKAEVGSSILPGGTTLNPLSCNDFRRARGRETAFQQIRIMRTERLERTNHHD